MKCSAAIEECRICSIKVVLLAHDCKLFSDPSFLEKRDNIKLAYNQLLQFFIKFLHELFLVLSLWQYDVSLFIEYFQRIAQVRDFK